jgi:hypothetical protein
LSASIKLFESSFCTNLYIASMRKCQS